MRTHTVQLHLLYEVNSITNKCDTERKSAPLAFVSQHQTLDSCKQRQRTGLRSQRFEKLLQADYDR